MGHLIVSDTWHFCGKRLDLAVGCVGKFGGDIDVSAAAACLVIFNFIGRSPHGIRDLARLHAGRVGGAKRLAGGVVGDGCQQHLVAARWDGGRTGKRRPAIGTVIAAGNQTAHTIIPVSKKTGTER